MLYETQNSIKYFREVIQDKILSKKLTKESLKEGMIIIGENSQAFQEKRSVDEFIDELKNNLIVKNKQMNELRETVEDNEEQVRQNMMLRKDYSNAEEIIKILLAANEIKEKNTKDLIKLLKESFEKYINRKNDYIEKQLSDYGNKLETIIDKTRTANINKK